MKTRLLVFFTLLIATVTFTQAQSKKDIEADLSKCTTTKDSIQNLLSGLSTSYDSINKACIAYDTMYNVVKEKVLLYDFDPANMSELIDSLRTGRDNTFTDATNTLNDSISILVEENAKLNELIDGLKGESDDDEIINDLKQLKELLDAEIITQEEFNAKKTTLLERL